MEFAIDRFLCHFLCLMIAWVNPILAQRCPRGCRCQDAVIDSAIGKIVNCSSLHEEVLPRIPTNAFVLDFKENRLDRIPNNIIQLTELRVLNMSKNRIHYQIPSIIFRANTKLKILDLSENHISVFSENALAGLDQLEKLDLHNNLLRGLPDGIFKPLPSVTVVCMGHNHWCCDCQLHYTVRWFLNRNSSGWIEFCDGGIPGCSLPANLHGRLFSEIDIRREVPPCEGEYQTTELPTTHHVKTNQATTSAKETEENLTNHAGIIFKNVTIKHGTLNTKSAHTITESSSGSVGNNGKFNKRLIFPLFFAVLGVLFAILTLAFLIVVYKLKENRGRRNRIMSACMR